MISVDPTDDKIRNFLDTDLLGRNAFLGSLLSILETINDGSIIDVDGQWGSGKTVLAKEIGILSVTEMAPKDIDDDVLSKLRSDYSVFYYNAWENDQYDPAESIVFRLLSCFWGKQEKIANKVSSFVRPFVSGILNLGTLGLVDVDKAKECEYIQGLFDGVNCLNRREEAAEEIIDSALKKADKKHLLFIVDELDRCNPAFAVKLIETIKHYFSSGAVKVLFLTNNLQLSSIIEHNYGEKFSGYEYLDKMFDLIITVPVPERRRFIDLCATDLESYQKDALSGVADYYNMSLREIERYVVLFKASKQYLNSFVIRIDSTPQPLKFFARHLLLPMILGAKIKNQNDYNALIGWGMDGRDVVKKMSVESGYGREIIRRCSSPNYPVSAEMLYGQLMMNSGRYNDAEEISIRELVADMTSMLGILPDNIDKVVLG